MRQIIKLSGLWDFVPDLDPKYHSAPVYAKPDWNRANWEKVGVPGCWNKYSEKYSLFEGVTWYAKEFCINEINPHTMAHFRFGAINYLADIFLNGELIGKHEGGYTQFQIDGSKYIKKGINTLAIRVDNRRDIIKFPGVIGWFNYGGINKDVELILSERIFIEYLLVSAVPDNNTAKGKILLKTKLHANSRMKFIFKVKNISDEIVWQETKEEEITTDDFTLMKEFNFNSPSIWDLVNHDLYELSVSIKDDRGNVLDNTLSKFAVRKIETNGQKILLNGKPIQMKGICYLPDHPSSGVVITKSVLKEDFANFKELGINAIRCHFPLDEKFLCECDKRGILVWSEVPIYCVYAKDEKGKQFSDGKYSSLARQMIREMVIQSYNHPSVAIWSIGNECNESHPAAAEFFKKLVTEIKQIDKERPIGYACCAFDSTSCVFNLGAIEKFIDIIGINEYMGWYDRCHGQSNEFDLSKLDKALSKLSIFNKPVLMTEFAADAIGGYHADESILWSEEYQCFFYRESFKLIQKHQHIAGAFPFLYNDYMDPSKSIDGHWNGQNLKGFVTYNRTKKLSFETLKQIYRGYQNE